MSREMDPETVLRLMRLGDDVKNKDDRLDKVDAEVTRRVFERVDKEKVYRIMEDGTMSLNDDVPLFFLLQVPEPQSPLSSSRSSRDISTQEGRP